MNRDLSLFQQFRFRTPAATICRLVALFAVGLSRNQIEQLTGVKGETIGKIIERLVTDPCWVIVREIVGKRTGTAARCFDDLDKRQLQMEQTGENVLAYQGCEYRWRDAGQRRQIAREAKRIVARKISFGPDIT
jgi:hypothetical protein